jgi:hypothetical protein
VTNYRKQIETALEATLLLSPTNFSWFGKRFGQLSSKVKESLSASASRAYLLHILQARLYSDFYCTGFAALSIPDRTDSRAADYSSFVEQLSAANGGKGYSQNSWKTIGITDKELIVQRDNLSLWIAKRNHTIVKEQINSISLGSVLNLRFPKEFLGMSPGFYVALSDIELISDDSQTVVRYYWNIRAEGALSLMRQLTLSLNEMKVPFNFKVLNNPYSYNRCDAAVLYIRKIDLDSVTSIIEKTYHQVRSYLKPDIPCFTKLLAPGLGLAEDPGEGESFGMHRCKIMAKGMIYAFEQRQKSLEDRLKTVMNFFAKANVRVEVPFLNPGSSDIYNFPFDTAKSINLAVRQDLLGERTIPLTFLKTASEIAEQLTRAAIWYNDKCTWLAFELANSVNLRSNVNYSAVGPDLYAGTSGIALFLGELYAISGNKNVRRTAIGAISHALSRVDMISPLLRFGFFTGWLGIAHTAIRLGTLMNEERLIDQGKVLLYQTLSNNSSQREFDLLSGRAGAIPVLICLCKVLNDLSLSSYATQLGDELIEAAEKSRIGYSWGSKAFPNRHNLTGFSHGTAGVGYALMELFQMTGELRFRSAAEQAFSFERYWFDAEARNWPDFREETRRVGKGRQKFSFATFWCHGAPGIALSRLRAFEISSDLKYAAEAMNALETTSEQINQWLQSGTGNYSLCHGLAGNCEVLIHGMRILRGQLVLAPDLVQKVAAKGIASYGRHGHKWPCGSGDGESPGLMLGLAGIGYFYLRLHDPSVSSILLIN